MIYKRIISALIMLSMLFFLSAAYAEDITRYNTLWFEKSDGDIVTISLSFIQTKENVSYGLEFTSPNDGNYEHNLVDGRYTAQAMVRLASDNYVRVNKDGGWIPLDDEKNSSFLKASFTQGEWHSLKVRFSMTALTADWYLDGTYFGQSAMKDSAPLNAISVFGAGMNRDGLEIKNLAVSNLDTETEPYFEKNDLGLVSVTKNNSDGKYYGTDSLSYISDSDFKVNNTTKLIKRYEVTGDVTNIGRYRVHGTVTPSAEGGAIELYIYKDGEKVWEQLFPEGESGVFDVRIFGAPGTTIDVGVTANKEEGYQTAGWSFSIEKFVGTPYSEADTGQGYSYNVTESTPLKSYVMKGDTRCYSIRYDVEHPMALNSDYNGYNSVIKTDYRGGYISSVGLAQPGKKDDSVMEITVPKTGILKITGDLILNSKSDGVVVDICHNGKKIWSSRVGGERAVRWDEPFDTSYFSFNVNCTAYVEKGDKLSFTFDQWRKVENDDVNFNGVELNYISGDFCSETTKWKLKKSVYIDSENKKIEKDGTRYNADIKIDNGTVLVAAKDLEKIYGSGAFIPAEALLTSDAEYCGLEASAEANGKNIVFADNNDAVIYDDIPTKFGWTELSEINTMNFVDDMSLTVEAKFVNRVGLTVTKFAEDVKYYASLQAKNISSEAKYFYIILAEYNADKTLRKLICAKNIEVPGNGEIIINQNSGTDAISFTPYYKSPYLKLFIFKNGALINPIASAVTLEKGF